MPDHAPGSRQKISDLILEQYNLGELRPAAERRVRLQLEQDGELRDRLAALQGSDQEIRARYPAERIVPLIRERALRSGAEPARDEPARTDRPRALPWRIPTLAWAIPVAAMALVLLSLPILLRPSDDTRMKGAASHLVVFRKTNLGAEELAPGSMAAKGDVLQISYVAGQAKFGVILSVDGRGTLTWHLPGGYRGGEMASPALDHHGPALLPNAYELDDAPGFERFFLVYSSRPFPVGEVDRAARARAAGDSAETVALKLSGGLGQASFLVRKG